MNKLCKFLLFFLLWLEGFSYLCTLTLPNLYDQRQPALAAITASDYHDYLQYGADKELGWDLTSKPANAVRQNCQGENYTYTHLPEKIRSNRSSFNPLDAAVLAAGDSFTYGDQVNDGQTYPAFLEKQLDRPVANLGVNGYDPLQALLKLQKTIALFPKAKIVVLGIIYDDLLRLPTSYRAVLYAYKPNLYGFKPYMKAGEIMPMASGVTQGLEAMKAQAAAAFDNDYWAKPVARFPYSYSLIRALAGNNFRLNALFAAASLSHQPPYRYVMRLPDMEKNYVALLQHYAGFAKTHHLKPVIVIIPQKDSDDALDHQLMALARQSFPDVFHFVTVQGIDWPRYISKGMGCHPTPYGYEMIARSVADEIRRIELQ